MITTPENRWGRCDIKTVGLLPNALAKQAARESGAVEAWFVDELGLVTEGASSNAWIVDADGRLRTRDTNANILRGITRLSLMDIAASLRSSRGAPVHAWRSQEAQGGLHHRRHLVGDARGQDRRPTVGDGKVGKVARRLREEYVRFAAHGGP